MKSTMANEKIRIYQERFKINFDTLSKIDATKKGGINRTTSCEAHQQARKKFLSLASNIGLGVKIDVAGNHIIRSTSFQRFGFCNNNLGLEYCGKSQIRSR